MLQLALIIRKVAASVSQFGECDLQKLSNNYFFLAADRQLLLMLYWRLFVCNSFGDGF